MNDGKTLKRSALITGASRRLGGEIALHLANKGWNIVIHYNSSENEALKMQKQIISMGRECHVIGFDFMSSSDPSEVVRKAKKIFPDLDLLINSASAYEPGPLAETTIDLFDRQFSVNLRAPLFLSKAFAENHKGLIINIIDNKIHFNQWEYGAYVLSKKALSELTLLSALEFAPRVRVNGIAPGIILPASSRSTDYLEWRKLGVPAETIGNPSQIMLTIDFIIENQFLNGQILTIDGGESVQVIGRHSENYYGKFSETQHIVALSVGSNIEPEANISAARKMLIEDQYFVGESQSYITKPVGLQEQPDFHNSVFVIRTGMTQDRLTKYLKRIEKLLGRIKGQDKTGPRTIDLDIIAWDGVIVDESYYSQEYVSVPLNEVKNLWNIST